MAKVLGRRKSRKKNHQDVGGIEGSKKSQLPVSSESFSTAAFSAFGCFHVHRISRGSPVAAVGKGKIGESKGGLGHDIR